MTPPDNSHAQRPATRFLGTAPQDGVALAIPFDSAWTSPSPEAMRFWGADFTPSAPPNTSIAESDRQKALDENNIVVTLSDQGEEGRWFADASGRVLRELDGLEDLLPLLGDQALHTVTLVTDVRNIPYDFLEDVVLKRAQTGVLFGLITGLGPAAIRWAALKSRLLTQHPLGNRALSLFASPPIGPLKPHRNVTTLWWDDLTANAVDGALRLAYDTVALMSHSNGVDGNFADCILCPVKPDDYLGDGLGGDWRLSPVEMQPSCLQTGLCQRDPSASKVRVHPERFQARVVFYDTCAGFLGAGGFSSGGAGLALGFLRGATGAVITSIRKKMSDPYATLLFRAMLHDGHRLGDIAAELNRYQRSEYGEAPSFIVLGDPAQRLAPHLGTPHPATPTVRDDETGVEDWSGRALKVHLKDQGGTHANPIIPPLNMPELICIDLRRNFGTSAHAWVLRPDGGPKTETAVRLSSAELSPYRDAIDWLSARLHRNIALIDMVRIGLKSQSGSTPVDGFARMIGACENLLMTLTAVRQTAKGCVWNGELALAFAEIADTIVAQSNDLSGAFCTSWIEARQWLVLHHHYNHALDASAPERIVERPCPCCAQKGLTEKRSHAPGHPGLERRMLTCVRCGVVADLPPEISWIAIEGRDGRTSCKPGETLSFTVRAEMDAPPSLELRLQPYFGGFGAAVVQADLPDKAMIALGDGPLGDGPQRTANFDVAFAENCPGGLYSLVIVGACAGAPVLAALYVGVTNPFGEDR